MKPEVNCHTHYPAVYGPKITGETQHEQYQFLTLPANQDFEMHRKVFETDGQKQEEDVFVFRSNTFDSRITIVKDDYFSTDPIVVPIFPERSFVLPTSGFSRVRWVEKGESGEITHHTHLSPNPIIDQQSRQNLFKVVSGKQVETALSVLDLIKNALIPEVIVCDGDGGIILILQDNPLFIINDSGTHISPSLVASHRFQDNEGWITSDPFKSRIVRLDKRYGFEVKVTTDLTDTQLEQKKVFSLHLGMSLSEEAYKYPSYQIRQLTQNPAVTEDEIRDVINPFVEIDYLTK